MWGWGRGADPILRVTILEKTFHASRYLKKHFMRREFKKETSTICLVCDFQRKIEVFKNGRNNSLVTSHFCS